MSEYYLTPRDVERLANKSMISTSRNLESCDLYVDMDGTVLRTDLIHESVWRYLKGAPWRAFQIAAVLLRHGRAGLKALLARKVAMAPSTLPYEDALVAFLARRKAEGQRIVLITAAHWRHARRIAAHLGLFDEVHGSSAHENLKGVWKLARIQLLCAGRPFDYAGDSPADRPIWRAARSAIFVNAPQQDILEAEKAGRVELVIRSRPPTWRALIKEMRLHQWAKNVLLFVPLLTSGTYSDMARVGLALAAFLAFGFTASGHYFLNDLLDLDADRAHRSKRHRPMASGDLRLGLGVLGALILPVLGFALSAVVLSWKFTATLLGYFLLTNLYSFYLKRVSTVDVVTLALLYTVRVVAGAVAISVAISSWLLAFSMFIFISLAYLKRYVEVTTLAAGAAKAGRRGYSDTDAETMFSLGIANATAGIVVLALYISSAEVKMLYREPDILWLLCVLLLYWSNRIWVGARRGKIHDDPVVFAIRDRVSQAVGLVALLIVLAAQILP